MLPSRRAKVYDMVLFAASTTLGSSSVCVADDDLSTDGDDAIRQTYGSIRQTSQYLACSIKGLEGIRTSIDRECYQTVFLVNVDRSSVSETCAPNMFLASNCVSSVSEEAGCD